ncbi:MAG: thiopurine S-methyltransferase [Thermoproteota archaeon]|jgi:thiopurine S-methyltransferase
MDEKFWISAWNDGRTKFHGNSVHALLKHHMSSFKLKNTAKVLVPLCGKTLDLIWLAQQGYEVVGAEFSQLAIESFFKENNFEYRLEQNKYILINQELSICIYHGDFLDLSENKLKHIDFIYDRAAMVALPKELREKYANKLVSLSSSGTQVLSVTLIRNQDDLEGPPFSVPRQEVLAFYSKDFKVEILSDEKKEDEPNISRLIYKFSF